jgi:ADP-ribose pyrophosphatase YjhB (NUDIX family)
MTEMIFLNADQEVVEYDGSPLEWRVSAYGIVIRDRKILLIKNKREKLFDIPGGGLELDETPDEAVAREGKEEAGTELKIGKIADVATNYFYHREKKKYYNTVQLFYVGELIGELGTPTDLSIEKVFWVELEKLNEFPLPERAKAAVEKALLLAK